MVETLQNARARQRMGRRTEIDALCELAEARSTTIAAVHGIAGVGKSTLLRAVTAALSGHGRMVVLLDCRVIEPTERGFLGALGDFDDVQSSRDTCSISKIRRSSCVTSSSISV